MTLKNLLIIGKQFEMCDLQTADIEDNNKTANEVNALRNEQRSNVKSECRNCGGEWPHIRGNYPAKGKECRNCGKLIQIDCRKVSDVYYIGWFSQIGPILAS